MNNYKFSSRFLTFISEYPFHCHGHVELDDIVEFLNTFDMTNPFEVQRNLPGIDDLIKKCFRYLYYSETLFSYIGVDDWINCITQTLRYEFGFSIYSELVAKNSNREYIGWLSHVGYDKYKIVINS